MDRKTKIKLNALNIKDRSCIDFLKVPKYERLGTTQNEQDLCIQRSQELFGNVTSQTRTPKFNTPAYPPPKRCITQDYRRLKKISLKKKYL
ncbi:unnamed protein product [Acanthoscelides obtectus]|uniref:Uncharacterized protein n=1 Tax=Acanthoscelides obtectus TaxID=200917 RepID=A0A9P0KJI9_ACAOB|nr:unnamed protein product [Acanthoscelides obtectus]CAK1681679.1 hypothetical protein AOBTE_LOCUS33207 [Acanthoscelides obtectus]